MKKREVLFFTGTRADWGLLSPLVMRFKEDTSRYQVQILASGAHLSERFGSTYHEIESDGFKIDEKVDILTDSDTAQDICISMGRALQEYPKALSRIKPDLCFVLGDRYEALAFALTCAHLSLPLAHLHGGEVTEGAVDEIFRHGITKAAYFHFAATQKARQRVIRLGENPQRVWNVGALGVENAFHQKKLSRQELEKDLQWRFRSKNLLVTFHPVTQEGDSKGQLKELLKALSQLDQEVGILMTAPNADREGQMLLAEIENWSREQRNVLLIKSLGKKRYLSVLNEVDGMVGNSSSGLIEAPALQTYTVNIGTRQRGRETAASVFSCPPEAGAILEKIKLVLDLKPSPEDFTSPYGTGETSIQIKKLMDAWSGVADLRKGFYEDMERHSD